MTNTEPQVKPAKKGLTTGKLISIFAGLLIVGAAVGAIIYAQGGGFLGDVFKLATRQTITTPITLTTTTTTTAHCTGVGQLPIPEPDGTYVGCMCDSANNFEAVAGTTAMNLQCQCKSGYSLSGGKCVEQKITPIITTTTTPITLTTTTPTCAATSGLILDTATNKCVCNTAKNFIANPDAIGTGVITMQAPPCVCKSGYTRSADKLSCDPPAITTTATTCDTSKGLVETTDASGAKKCVCKSPFIANPNITTTVTRLQTAPPCVCPDNTYFDQKASCTAIDCNLTDAVAATMLGAPDKYRLTTKTQETLKNFSAWKTANCNDCTTLKTEFATYYKAKNLDAALATLAKLVENKCITPCENTLFTAMSYMQSQKLPEALKSFNKYMTDNCGDCNKYYAIVVGMAANYSKIKSPDLTSFKTLLEKYITMCQCIDIESFLANPTYNPAELLDTTSSSTSSTSGTRLQNPATPISTTRLSSALFQTAYAQTAVTLSNEVKQAIEDVLKARCEKTTTETPECKVLSITAPTSSATWEIDYNYEVNDALKISADDATAVYNYRYTSSTGKFKFDGNDSPYTTTKTSVTITGGPAEGETEVITVEAYDAAGKLLPCSDKLEVKRLTQPTTEEVPECFSLNIVNLEGETVELDESGYINEPLEISVDSDAEAVSGYRFKSLNGTITFDGQGSSYDVASNVFEVSMNGGPEAGDEDTITVWALDPSGKGIQSCHDSYKVFVEEPYIPPTEETEIPEETPPTTVTQQPPVEEPQEVVIPATEKPVYHAAAPSIPKNGPEVILYFIGAGLGGLIFSRKKKK